MSSVVSRFLLKANNLARVIWENNKMVHQNVRYIAMSKAQSFPEAMKARNEGVKEEWHAAPIFSGSEKSLTLIPLYFQVAF